MVKNKLVAGAGGNPVAYTTVYWFANYEEEFVNKKTSARVKLYSANEGIFAQRTVTLDENENVTADSISYMFKDLLGSTLMTFGDGGKLAGLWSIRINDQWRIVFSFDNGGADNVRITDYH